MPALLLLVCATSPGVALQCEEGQTLRNNECVNCSTCSDGHRVIGVCTNLTDTKCARICKEYEIQNADYECDINCSFCTRGQGRCDSSEKRCECSSGYFGDICDGKIPTTAPPTSATTDDHQPENEDNKVIVIISIVCSIIAGVIVIAAIIVCYVACSRRSSHQLSESSDESTGSFHSSNSINNVNC